MRKDSGAYWRMPSDAKATIESVPAVSEPGSRRSGRLFGLVAAKVRTAGLLGLVAAKVRNIRSPQSPRAMAKSSGQILLRTVMAGSLLCAFLVLLGTGIPALFGYRTMIVTSGSMEPAVHVGDAVVIHSATAASIQPRDVITFSGGPTVGTITHRVLNVREIEGETYFQTQGDANPTPDPDLAAHAAVLGRVELTLPKMGYFLSFAMSLKGRIALVALPLLILMAQEGGAFVGSLRRPRDGDETAPV